eukprot:TRINITY_DN619_c1_g1_i1.p1 TRINITY_DN619_c1_g1~~TRINITY_DN619_c1_g1_i1.p1  ORF type:complete len:627 (+),score=91.24 TRINITY_DN619_c1_g1_i1:99-1979(+)
MKLIRLLVSLVAVAIVEGSGSFTDITEGLGALSSLEGTVSALGDWDSDRYVDLIVANGSTAVVYSGHTFQLFPVTMEVPGIICNVIAGDINYDGMLDVLLQYRQSPGDKFYLTEVFYQDFSENRTNPVNQHPFPYNTTDHMLALSFYGTMRIDFLATVHTGKPEPTVVIKNEGCERPEEGCVPDFSIPDDKQGQLKSNNTQYWPANSATVDIDGDCRADTVVRYDGWIEIWKAYAYGDPYEFENPIRALNVTNRIGFLTWYDIDSDGDMDAVAPFCASDTCSDPPTEFDSIIVIKNRQSSPGCSGYSCCNPSAFTFPDISSLEKIENNSDGSITISTLPPKSSMRNFVRTDGEVEPPVIRVCDYGNDGHPDLVITAMFSERYIMFMHNDGYGTFTSDLTKLLSVNTIPYRHTAFFFDIDEDGVSDLLLISTTPEGLSKIHAFRNDVHHSNHLFFKALGLNGRCNHDCKESFYGKPYGVNQPGVVHTIFYKKPVTFSSKNIYITGCQLSSSQHMSLQRPYVNFGMGSTNSYIEVYFSGYHIGGLGHGYHSWPQILPNSQVIVINNPLHNPDKWVLEMFVSPSRLFKWFLVITVVALVCLGIPITVLRCREMAADAAEKQERPLVFPM